MTFRTLLLLTTVVLSQAHGQSPSTKTLKVLTPTEIDPSRLLPPPPADGSDAQQIEIAEVAKMVKTRTAERYTRARWDSDHEDATLFAATFGPGFDLTKLPATAKLLDVVLNDQAIAASAAKDYFKRRFPVAAAGSLAASYDEWTCDKVSRKPEARPLRSYPSGHATLGYSVGAVLAALVPEKSQAILKRAAEYAHSREVCGDHYRSDVEASHALGNALGVLFLTNTQLRPQIEAAKTELRAARIN